MGRKDDNNRRGNDNASPSRDTGYDRNKEHGDHTEIEQPKPSIATPGIPAEMPAREIR